MRLVASYVLSICARSDCVFFSRWPSSTTISVQWISFNAFEGVRVMDVSGTMSTLKRSSDLWRWICSRRQQTHQQGSTAVSLGAVTYTCLCSSMCPWWCVCACDSSVVFE
jgi:hypothetical protein